jgi:hypothetical protein
VFVPEDWELWVPGANDAGPHRVERLRSLSRNLTGHGIDHRLDLVPGAGHRERQVFAQVQAFFAGLL